MQRWESRAVFSCLLDLRTLRSELDKAVSIIGKYEQSREEKDVELHRLKVHVHTHVYSYICTQYTVCAHVCGCCYMCVHMYIVTCTCTCM